MTQIENSDSEPWVYEVLGRVIEDAIQSYADLSPKVDEMNKWLSEHRSELIHSGTIKFKYLQLVHEYESAKRFLFGEIGGLDTYINIYGVPLDIGHIRYQAKKAVEIGFKQMKEKYSHTGKTDLDRDIMARALGSLSVEEKKNISESENGLGDFEYGRSPKKGTK